MAIAKLFKGLLATTAMLSLLPSSASLGRDSKRVAGAATPPSSALTAQNLQVLPQDTPYADLVLLMTRYSQEIGVQCVFCHTQNPQTEQIDFASDESPAKLTARIMIGMVRDINGKYLAQVTDRRYAVPITCGNCHQGQTLPPAFEAATSRGFAQPAPNVQWNAALHSTESRAGSENSLELSAVVPAGWHVYAATQLPGGPTPLRVSLQEGADARLTGAASGTRPQRRHDKSFDLDTEFYTGAFTLRLPLVWLTALGSASPLPVDVRFQTCSDRECQPPKTVHLAVATNAAVQK